MAIQEGLEIFHRGCVEYLMRQFVPRCSSSISEGKLATARTTSLLVGHVHPCVCLESGSESFICTLKCLLEKICHFLVCGCRGAIWMESTLDSGSHSLVAVHMSENFFGANLAELASSHS